MDSTLLKQNQPPSSVDRDIRSVQTLLNLNKTHRYRSLHRLVRGRARPPRQMAASLTNERRVTAASSV